METLIMDSFSIRAYQGEEFKENTYFYYKGEKYKVFESQQKYGSVLNPTFDVIAKHKPQLTKFNYDDTNFFFEVTGIERITQLEIVIHKQNSTSTITLETPAECLNEFLMLKQLQKEANGNEEFYKLRYQG